MHVQRKGEERLAQVQLVRKPRRWDRPFGRERLHRNLIGHVLSLPIFKGIKASDFPDDLALRDIIVNDARIRQFARGDVVFQRGQYGTSLYLVLCGSVRCLLTQDGEQAASPPLSSEQASWIQSLRSQLGPKAKAPSPQITNGKWLATAFPTLAWGRNQVFGELEALTRTPRGHTVFADSEETILLELRWPGVRELRHWSNLFRRRIDALYRRRGVEAGLRTGPLLAHVDEEALALIAKYARLETHGRLEWTHHYQRDVKSRGVAQMAEHEPLIFERGQYLDDLLLVRAGFARLTEAFDRGERTVGYLAKGEAFGLAELAWSLRDGSPRRARRSLRAIGYTDIIRIPALLVEKYVLPSLPLPLNLDQDGTAEASASQTMRDFLIDRRLINGTQAMVINTDRCVNCDDCVRACAATHDNFPRFVRHGPVHHNLMVAQACMHCVDPVCLFDCPTNAIHRDERTGNVIINEATCVGCGSCASACPYGNIRMQEVRNANSAFHIDEHGAHVLRATKCDLCTGRRGGPACQRACPHGALTRANLQDLQTLSDWLKPSP